MASLLRKLRALEYPHATEFQQMNDGQLRNLVVWLEDTKICLYKIDDREAIRNIESQTWGDTFSKYLQDLNCPRLGRIDQAEDRREILDWIVGHAVALDYGDHKDLYGEARKNSRSTSRATADSELHLARPELEKLASMLLLPLHENDETLLRAITNVLTTKFTNSAVATAIAGKDEIRSQIPLDYTPLGFETGDSALNKACKILRLLHINDLRDLQTNINELIVAVQTLTANPKTNSRLGKVGK
eukprot:m.761947 g.761947  ORF g.761947 m.761947 type:complete len:245 (-) comp23207_c1_seq1:446-1180(-)